MYANAGGYGYYRTSYDDADVKRFGENAETAAASGQREAPGGFGGDLYFQVERAGFPVDLQQVSVELGGTAAAEEPALGAGLRVAGS